MEKLTILRHLLHNQDYLRKVLPYLKSEYFLSSAAEAEIFKIIETHVGKYSKAPTAEVIEVEFGNAKLQQVEYDHGLDLIKEMGKNVSSPDLGWLLETTENFCVVQSAIQAITKSFEIIESNDQPLTAIPEMLREAISVSFDRDVGHNYISNSEARYKKLREQTERLKFDLDDLNKIFGGGCPRKTLTMFVGGTGAGKSLVKSHVAASFYKQGYNVLYLTLELSEERIGERFDANLFDVQIDELYQMTYDQYKTKLDRVASTTNGAQLFIKEFPPATISATHIRALLDELRLKQNFVPDVLVVDYINLMNSSRYKPGSNNNSYTILKAVAEELRALAVERNMACITSTQTNRSGNGASDLDLTNTSESMGIAHTSDVMIGIIRTEELDTMNQILLKCLKTRFSDKTNFRFLVSVELAKMKLKGIQAQGYVAQAGYKPTTKPESQPVSDIRNWKPNPPRREFGNIKTD